MSEAFTTLLKNIADLFKVKTILSLLVIITTCILTFREIVSIEAFMAIAASIITYYFTKKEDTVEEVLNSTNDDTTIEELEDSGYIEENEEESEG